MVGETIGVDEVTGLIESVLGRKLEVRKVGKNELKRRLDSVEGIGKNEEMFLKMNSEVRRAYPSEEW